MGIIKDFTQNAYDDIKGYIGGTEDWEEIESLYGAVDYCNGIYQNDYLGELQSEESAYNDENELAIRNLDFLFDGVNSVDDNYAVLFRDEQMDMSSFSTAITELAGLLNKNSVENIYTMDVNALGNKIDIIKLDAQNQLIEYYKSSFYSVTADGNVVMNWEEIYYEMRKDRKNVSNSELTALASIFAQLYSENDEQTLENIENMIRAGYGKLVSKEWEGFYYIDDVYAWKKNYHSVGVTDTFKDAVELYNAIIDQVNYMKLVDLRDSGEISETEFIKLKEQYAMSSLFKTLIDYYPTVGVEYTGLGEGFKVHKNMKDEKVSASVCLGELPFDISIGNTGPKGDGIDYYQVDVANGKVGKTVDKKNLDKSQIHIYGMVHYTNVGNALIKSVSSKGQCLLEDEKQDEIQMDNIIGGGLSNIVRDKILEDTAKLIFNGGDKFVPGVNLVISTFDGMKENEKIEAHNNQIDDKVEDLKKTSDDAQIIIDYSKDFCMNMQIKCMDGDFKIERININSEKLESNLKDYNDYIDEKEKRFSGKTQDEIKKNIEVKEKMVTTEDVLKFLENNCDEDTIKKIKKYRDFLKQL